MYLFAYVCLCVYVYIWSLMDIMKKNIAQVYIYFQIQQTHSKPGKHWTGNSNLVAYCTIHSMIAATCLLQAC